VSFKTYDSYKESGIAWLGKVPAEWKVTAIKHGFDIKLGKMLQPDLKGKDDTLAPYIRAANIQWKGVDARDVKLMWFSPAERVELALQEDDLLVSEGGDVGRACLWGNEMEECYFQNSLNRVRSKPGNSSSFARYWLSALKDKGFIDVLCNKSTIAHYTAEKLAATAALFPPHVEQVQITNFLDRETAKIDALIAQQQRLIELLQEKRQAAISHAVTKGLNPNAPMKESGVEWLGEVPEHWVVASIRRYIRIAEGQVDPRLDPYSAMTLIAPNHLESGTGLLTSLETAGEQGAESGKYLCDLGDVVYSKIRPALRKACIAPETCLTSADMYPLKAMDGMSNEFLLNFLLSPQFSALAIVESERVAMPKINRDALLAVSVAVPPLSEQQEICSHVKELTTRIDQLSVQASSSITLMNERRTALISAAVTGQIDVRGLSEAECGDQ
jgi:type I restriction enzyme, S subunit